jgi:hypothetical protein
MIVINKDNNKQCRVYDITYDKAGYPRFLVHKDNQWVRMSAKHFKPCTFESAVEELKNLKNKSFKNKG